MGLRWRETLKNLLPDLRWLDWRECHFIPELCNMDLKKLLILDLSRSPVTKYSRVWRQIMEASQEVAPELAQMKSLKELLIDGTGIETIHIQKASLQKLEKLSACGCEKLKDISPIGHLTKLKSLALDGAINWHPENPKPFEFPQNLRRLSLRNCERLSEVPPSMGNLRLLEVMDLSYTGIIELPGSVKDLRHLKTLKMEHTHLQKFPEDIVKLKKLEEIDFSGCRSLRGQVPCDISGLSSLRILRLSSSNVAGLPQGICGHSRLQILDILRCNRLQALPELPSSLLSLRWGSRNMTVLDLSYLTNLKELCLKDYKQPEAWSLGQTPNVEWITRLPSLETLQLSVSKVTNLPGNFSALTQLRELSLSYMKELDLTQLPSSSLLTLRLKHCKIPKPTFSSLQHHLSELKLKYCELAEIVCLEDLNRLVVLIILYCKGVTNLNGLKDLPRLRKGHKIPQTNSWHPAIGSGINSPASKPLLKPVGCILQKPSAAAQLFDCDEKEKTKK
ncbi:disease resistance protein RPV1 [Eucalyptus grandis]|uniref:disease resistance protein RPV1 n=1 Tax=Eucalyptus grandis TaxID=71139 RepID=UPI00192EB719|nr:disease resistance protein RPV1 [Eucalyptus grandis]